MNGIQCKERRKELRLSVRALAKLSGISFASISRYERGITDMPAKRLQKLADALGIDYAVNESVMISELRAIQTRIAAIIESEGG